MPPMLKPTLAMLLGLWIGGCTATVDQPMRIASKPDETTKPIKNYTESYAELVRGFDRTLTENERRAVIARLQKEGSARALLSAP
jgi:hypothetical protein